MDVAWHYTLLTLLTLFSLFILFKLLYTAETAACMLGKVTTLVEWADELLSKMLEWNGLDWVIPLRLLWLIVLITNENQRLSKRDHRHRTATKIWRSFKSTDKNCSCASFTIKASKFKRSKSQLFGSWLVGKGKNCCIKPDMCQFRRPIRVLTTWCDVLVVVVVLAVVAVLS